ncbi:MAG TPA: putative Na+/H+ antiporter [Vicinamibacterales bacterium]|nr:putative Na+/H+ antiporter [Vicinamibacterales bacterium]
MSLEDVQSLPRELSSYANQIDASILQILADRIRLEPFNAVATAIFVAAIVHTFNANRFTQRAHRLQREADARARAQGHSRKPSVAAEIMHFLGEVEVIFGLWAIVLLLAMVVYAGWDTSKHYFNDTVNYTEALFVVVVMALAATRPIVTFAEAALRRVAALGRGTPAAWWMSILIVGPLLGSFITEPAAMTICALLLARQFFDLEPSTRLKYATLGLLFVNVSIGGTLTHFAAPPVLMVARTWDWGLLFMLGHFGWRAALAITISTAGMFLIFNREFRELGSRAAVADVEESEDRTNAFGLLPVPRWLTGVHVGFLAWTVLTAHYPALFIGGFLIFLGFSKATAAYQSMVELKTPLLVGFFLAGLVIHGGLQGWWIAPVLARLAEAPLFFGATLLTAFNDNALITYLATLVPNLSEPLKVAVVEGAVTGGGLTVIANAPNPAGQALLSRFFGGSVSPIGLLLGALGPTVVAIVLFRVF